MRNKFSEFFLYTDSDLVQLWDTSLFVFDTNVLLNLYRYSDNTTIEFLNIIEKVKDKLWLPYNTVIEFFNNRLNVISDQIKIYKEFREKVNSLKNELSNKNRNPFLTPDLSRGFTNTLDDIFKELLKKESYYEEMLTKDDILIRISNIFLDKIGDKYTNEKLDNIYKEGKERYNSKTPPGYKDQSKPDPAKYGDLIIWFQIIDKALSAKKPVILITDDRKEDWWLELSGKTISPQPALLREFIEKTQQKCHFYKPFQFLFYANKYIGSNITPEIIKEVEYVDKKWNTHEIYIELILSTYHSENVTKFLDILTSNGYHTDYMELPQNKFKIVTSIPDIEDLVRRFQDIYLPFLSKYNLTLIKFTKHSNPPG